MAPNIKTVSTDDYGAVLAVVQKYVDGLKVGDNDMLKEAFHPNATMYGFVGSQLTEGPIENLYTYVTANGKAPNVKTRIDVLAITQTTAVVRVDMERDAADIDYTDFHTLLKQDGRWRIIAKTFHAYESA